MRRKAKAGIEQHPLGTLEDHRGFACGVEGVLVVDQAQTGAAYQSLVGVEKALDDATG